MKVTLFTIFPEMFPGPLENSIAGKALEEGKWFIKTVNIRDFAKDKHRTVDDKPFGGGVGMVMKPEVLSEAIDSAYDRKSKIIYMSPRGKTLNQKMARDLSKEEDLFIICGRYEGIDERILEEYNVEEISIGDYVLSGGEIPALVLIDTCIRNISGVIGNALALEEESFSAGLLEYPHYTRPAQWRERTIPEVLLSGNHADISKWRQKKSEEITADRRKDLWTEYKKKR